MILATAHGVILDANPEACRLLQRTRGEITSTDLDAFFDPLDPRLEPAHEERRSEGRFDGELRLLRGDGTPLSAEVSMVGYRDGDGEERVGVIFRDIAERKRAEEELRRSEKHFRLLVENTIDVLSIQDSDGTARYLSPSIEDVLGYRLEEVVGDDFLRKISNLVHRTTASGR